VPIPLHHSGASGVGTYDNITLSLRTCCSTGSVRPWVDAALQTSATCTPMTQDFIGSKHSATELCVGANYQIMRFKYMRNHFYCGVSFVILSASVLCGSVFGQTRGNTIVSASHVGGRFNLVRNGTIYFQPLPAPARTVGPDVIASSGGQILGEPLSALATNGAFSIAPPDAVATTPSICYAVTVVNNGTGATVPETGLSSRGNINGGGPYGCVQPKGSAFEFDAYVPTVTSNVINMLGNSPYLLSKLAVRSILPANAAAGRLSASYPNISKREINPLAYGAICDGRSHPLSSFYATLAAAQVDFPFITSLTQQMDYAAFKEASNIAFGPDGSEHGTNTALNVPLQLPSGTCNFGSDEWLIRNADGIRITGMGKTTTILTGTGIVIGFDGLWYSQLSDFDVYTSGATTIAAMDIDGNVPGHPYRTRAVQGNMLQNIMVGGGGASTGQYALAWCRQGGNKAQCSENTMLNVHLSNSIHPYFLYGFNALDNVWTGGDVQNFSGDGIYSYYGTLNTNKISEEGLQGCAQITKNAYDFRGSAGGVGGSNILLGNRTEDFQVGISQAAAPMVMIGVTSNPGHTFNWSANTAEPLNWGTYQKATDGYNRLYCVTTAGTTGAIKPAAWPTSGMLTDGTVTYTERDYDVANLPAGRFDFSSNYYPQGGTVQTGQFEEGGQVPPNPATSGYMYVIDATGAVSEAYLSSQGAKGGLYANPQSMSEKSARSGMTWPASSAGVWYPTVTVELGNSNANAVFDRPNLQTRFYNHSSLQLILSRNAVNVASGINFQMDGNTVIPSTVAGFHGTSPTNIQMSDGTGANGNLASFNSGGNTTDSGMGAANVLRQCGTAMFAASTTSGKLSCSWVTGSSHCSATWVGTDVSGGALGYTASAGSVTLTAAASNSAAASVACSVN
jgi:hypothetical protein